MPSFTPKGLIKPTPPTILIENLLPDPHLRDSVWNQNGALGTLSHPTVGGPNDNGYFEFDITTANTGSPMSTELNTATGVNAIPCVPGETYNLSCWAFRDTPNVAESQRFTVTWYNAAGGTISTDNTSNVPLAENPAIRVDKDVVAPALAAFMKPRFAWSGTYPAGTTLRAADAQVTKGAGVKPFVVNPITDDDGDYVDINQLNANLDRASLMGVGARPLLSSEHPAFGSIDDLPGTIIFETDNNGILVRRRGTAFGSNNLDANYRSVAPGNWAEWNSNNPFSSWLAGDNNYKHVRISMLGRLIHVHLEARIGTGGSIIPGGAFLPSQLPTNRDTSVESGFGGDAITAGPWPVGHAVANIGGNIYFGRVVLSAASPVIRTVPTSNTSGGSAWSNTVPAAWGVGDGISVDFRYWSS